jgi:hypothetical protein
MTVAPDLLPSRDVALDFLRTHEADTMPHLTGTLLEHLEATEDILRSWGSGEALCRAGLCHAAYGTDGFAPFLIARQDRHVLAEVVGERVENTIYLYASCDRGSVYPQFPGHGPVQFRDRWDERTVDVTDADLRDFADLTLANELEIALSAQAKSGASSELSLNLSAWIKPLVEQMQDRASDAGRREAQRLLGQVV